MKKMMISSLAVPMLIAAVSPVKAQVPEALDDRVLQRKPAFNYFNPMDVTFSRSTGHVSLGKPAQPRPHVEDVLASSEQRKAQRIPVAGEVYENFQAGEFTKYGNIFENTPKGDTLYGVKLNPYLDAVLSEIAKVSKHREPRAPIFDELFIPKKKPVVSDVRVEEEMVEKVKSQPTITVAAPVEPSSNETGLLSTASRWFNSAYNYVASFF